MRFSLSSMKMKPFIRSAAVLVAAAVGAGCQREPTTEMTGSSALVTTGDVRALSKIEKTTAVKREAKKELSTSKQVYSLMNAIAPLCTENTQMVSTLYTKTVKALNGPLLAFDLGYTMDVNSEMFSTNWPQVQLLSWSDYGTMTWYRDHEVTPIRTNSLRWESPALWWFEKDATNKYYPNFSKEEQDVSRVRAVCIIIKDFIKDGYKPIPGQQARSRDKTILTAWVFSWPEKRLLTILKAYGASYRPKKVWIEQKGLFSRTLGTDDGGAGDDAREELHKLIGSLIEK
jgi:hypothetical protein